MKQVKRIYVSWIYEKKKYYGTQWDGVSCAYKLAMKYANDNSITYRAVVRLRSDIRFDYRYDFQEMAIAFQERAGIGKDWLAIPHSRRFDVSGCEKPKKWELLWSCCIDSIAVGTPRAMSDYTSYNSKNVDNLPIFHEDYVLFSSFRRFRFDGSIASGMGPYGTAVSGDFKKNRIGGPCFLSNGTIKPYPKFIVARHAINLNLKPTVCRDSSAAKLFTFDWRGIQPALRFHPFSGLQKPCFNAAECISEFYPIMDGMEASRCPPNVRIINHTSCLISKDHNIIPCKLLGCLPETPTFPAPMEYIRLMYTDKKTFEYEASIHRKIDSKFILEIPGSLKHTMHNRRSHHKF